jgi:hypothetical protein
MAKIGRGHKYSTRVALGNDRSQYEPEIKAFFQNVRFSADFAVQHFSYISLD